MFQTLGVPYQSSTLAYQFSFLFLLESVLNFRRVTGMLDLGECPSLDSNNILSAVGHLYKPHHHHMVAILCSYDLVLNKLRFSAVPARYTSAVQYMYTCIHVYMYTCIQCRAL